MKYVKPLPANEVSGLTSQIYKQIKNDFGALVDPFLLHSASPDLLAGIWCACRESLVAGKVRRELKEAVAATVSRINQCPYCVDAHTIMLHSTASHQSAEAIMHQKDHQITDPEMRDLVSWAAATRSPESQIITNPPFSKTDSPEIIGTAVVFHYINRMVTVLLDETPLPSKNRFFKQSLKRVAGWFFSRAMQRPKIPGTSLEFLPEASLPIDLEWATPSPNVAGAFARFAFVIENDVMDDLPKDVFIWASEKINQWDGSDPELGRGWVDEATKELDSTTRIVAKMLLLTAFAPYQIDDTLVHSFTDSFPGEEKLLSTLAWASFTTARRIGSWLQTSDS